ncbi:helicase-related protein [Paenibacillus tarimensis]|uniref:helicase-related protein n=1 Tax=Paenibacillus tarimensis TaxID=416012 RepID=UPI001F3C4978|nr:helicase-related protein [Paenibacillus tarimensis]MCF2944133.1 DEAD/DEAH box helicase family protein [Paenibacillus tarimensis]
MKAVVYAVRLKNVWEAGAAVDMDVVIRYYLDELFREQVRAESRDGDEGALAAAAKDMMIWDEPLPLGIALAAAKRFDRLTGGRGTGETLGRGDSHRRCIERGRDFEVCMKKTFSGAGLSAEQVLKRSVLEAGLEGEPLRMASGSGGRPPGSSCGGRVRRIRPGSTGGTGGTHRASATAGEARALAAAAQTAAAALQGRALLGSEAHALLGAAGAECPAAAGWSGVLQLAALLGRLRLCSAIARDEVRRWPGARPRRRLRCLRCGSGEAKMRSTPCAACGRVCACCEACILLGRSRECELLIIGSGQRSLGMPAAWQFPAPNRLGQHSEEFTAARQAPAHERIRRWKLSPAQAEAAGAALAFIEQPVTRSPTSQAAQRLSSCWAEQVSSGPAESTFRSLLRSLSLRWTKANNYQHKFLLWAVTGAGKTEMIFPLVESAAARGGQVLIATPRRDVVLELDPRIRKAFPDLSVVTLYGGSPQRWERGTITLATTHQLMRFREAFDLVIIDELDAFPYHGDPILHFAAEHAAASEGRCILLSATPPALLQRAATSGRLQHARVPVRFHRHPLPVPVQLRVPPAAEILRQKQVPAGLKKVLLASVSRGAQVFVFVQRINLCEPIAALLRTFCPADLKVGCTSSQDEERADKVNRFRSGELRVLVTTTILERGVTIPRSDVFILDADSRLFDEAALVQMSGRAGRSADDPAGRVYYCSSIPSRAQRQAVRHIRVMNRMAAAKGYIIQSGEGSGG